MNERWVEPYIFRAVVAERDEARKQSLDQVSDEELCAEVERRGLVVD